MQLLQSFIASLRWADGVDVIVMSIIIYRFLLILQGTRAVQMLIGLSILGVLWWASSSYELFALSWLFRHFFDYIFIIIIVLFQDQIKSALVSFGGSRIFSRASKEKIGEQIEEVSEAIGALSRERTGALIVFERAQGLLNYSLTGTRLDAKVHSDVLYSLFQTKSPLHDGAIILYNGLILSAGCYLPLSKNVEIDRHLGTRHRAALGITEVSDAVVVVVSEETGRISICVNQSFIIVSNEEELRDQLRNILNDESSREYSLSRSNS